MTDPTTDLDRIPLTRSVRYVVRGLPDVPNQYGPGVLRPSEITLTYRAAPDSGLGRVHAYVAGRIFVDGNELPLQPGGLYGQHYHEGLPNWPEWLAEEARLHDPAVSLPPADQTAEAEALWDELHRRDTETDQPRAADQTALRDRIAKALSDEDARACGWGHEFLDRYGADAETDGFVDAVLAVLPATTGQTADEDATGRCADCGGAFVPGSDVELTHNCDDYRDAEPAPVDRAAVLEAEAALILKHCPDHGPQDQDGVWMDCHCAVADDMRKRAAGLRRMADETPAAECSCAVLRTGPGRHLPECPNRPAAGARQDGAQQS